MFEILSQKFSSLFSFLSQKKRLTESDIQSVVEKIEEAFLSSDIPLSLIEKFTAELKGELVGVALNRSLKPSEQVMKVVHDKMVGYLGGEKKAEPEYPRGSVVLFLGLQGAGKTTTVSKLANRLSKRGRRMLMASVDFSRPAAREQLRVLAKSLNVACFESKHEDVVQAVRDAVAYQKENNFDHLLVDTAGRLHVDATLMDELKEIKKACNPVQSYLVIDGMTGQESLNVAQQFNTEVGIDGAIITKLDSDARGGVAFALRYALKKDVVYIATGEKPDDLELFHPDRIASRMIGMGDIKTLAERAEQKIKQDEQQRMDASLKKGQMSLQDFIDQLHMIERLGSLGSLMSYLPGGMGRVSAAEIEQGEQRLKKFKAIVQSMTKKERMLPAIINGARQRRIAAGAGVGVAEVRQLLTQFQQMNKLLRSGMFGMFK